MLNTVRKELYYIKNYPKNKPYLALYSSKYQSDILEQLSTTPNLESRRQEIFDEIEKNKQIELDHIIGSK